MEEVFHPRDFGEAMLDIVKVLFVVFFTAHLVGCSFFFLASSEDQEKDTWVNKMNIPLSDWFGLYISGVYFAFITMITLGYGDIVPVTTKERIFVIAMTLVSCAVFAYSINKSTQTIIYYFSLSLSPNSLQYNPLSFSFESLT